MKNPKDIYPEVAALLCDFSFNGFYILYYVPEMIYNGYIKIDSGKDKLDAWIERHPKKDYRYFNQLLTLYRDAQLKEPATDQKSSENFDEEITNDNTDIQEDSDKSSSAPIGWRQALNANTFNLLLDVVDPENKLDDNTRRRNALKYVCKVRKEVDKSGIFFWDVLPRDLILENIVEVKTNAG